MENASKALLIAGAILIVIVLISIGVLIVNRSSSVTDQASDFANQSSVQSFNRQFEIYYGTQQGSSVKNLLSAIAANNAQTTGSHKIKVTIVASGSTEALSGTDNSTSISAKISEVKNSQKYKVDQTAMNTDGYITEIKITIE